MKTNRPLRTLSTTVAIAALIVCLLALTAPSAYALFTNGSFEDGTLNGWTHTTFLNFGLSGSAPFTGASIVRTAGGTDLTQVLGPFAPMSQPDANTGGVLHYPLSGSYCAVVNFQGKNRNANSLLQQDTVTAGNVAPDGKIHVQLAWAAVVQNPAHLDTEQPYVYMALKNVTKGTLLYEAFEFAGTASIWQNAASSVQFTDWQVMDIAPDISALAPGDKVEVEAIAAGCSLSGHWGYLYVDRFGSFFPVTPHVTAADKIYDGTTDATITGRTLSNVVPGDDVRLTGGTATFDTATIGAGKTVTATGLTLTGADADKYMLTSFSATTTASIIDLPVVTTTGPSAITAATANSGGDVTTDNASAVTARGVCWSTSANPTITDSHTVNGTGTGVFSSQMTGLADNTLYHVRAYATNQAGTSYGSDLTFTTDMFVDFVTDGTAGATLTGNASQHVPSGGGATAVTANAPVGHHFVEWTFSTGGSSTDNPLTIDPVTASVTATAHFDIDVNTITASAGAHGKISPQGAVLVDYGSDQLFTITPDAHYHVADVLVDGVSKGAHTRRVRRAVGSTVP